MVAYDGFLRDGLALLDVADAVFVTESHGERCEDVCSSSEFLEGGERLERQRGRKRVEPRHDGRFEIAEASPVLLGLECWACRGALEPDVSQT